jgi:hypothetical protein
MVVEGQHLGAGELGAVSKCRLERRPIEAGGSGFTRSRYRAKKRCYLEKVAFRVFF